MNEEHVQRSVLSRAGWFLGFIPLGCISILFIVTLTHGQGFVRLEMTECVTTWILIGFVSAVGFAGCCPRLSWFALAGWLLGQAGLLIWDMAPSDSPSAIIKAIDTGHVALYSVVLVAILNWPIAPGFIIGRIVKFLHGRLMSKPKITVDAALAAAK
jgi:hypothetical protein